MVPAFHTEKYGALEWSNGFLKDWKGKRLPGGEALSYSGAVGTIVVQETQHEEFLFRYFAVALRFPVSLVAPLEKGFQSYLAIKGNLNCRLNGGGELSLSEGRFLLFQSKAGEVEAQFEQGKECEFYSIVYYPSFYKEWRSLFPKISIGARIRRFFMQGAVHTSPPGSIDAITELFRKKIEPYLQSTFTYMKIKESLLLMLQEDNDPNPGQTARPRQVELAKAARTIITTNFGVHYTNIQLAEMLNVERSVLTKAFRRVYRQGMHEFLIQFRFEKAREMLVAGESIRNVADAVGYKSSATFSAQFRSFYGYSPLDLQNGQA